MQDFKEYVERKASALGIYVEWHVGIPGMPNWLCSEVYTAVLTVPRNLDIYEQCYCLSMMLEDRYGTEMHVAPPNLEWRNIHIHLRGEDHYYNSQDYYNSNQEYYNVEEDYEMIEAS